MPERALLGDILINKGLITKQQLQQALLEQKKSNKRLGRVIIDLGFVSEEVMMDYLSGQIADILEECEESISSLFNKPITKKILLLKKIPLEDNEVEREVYRRLYACRKKLTKAKEMFKKGVYDEVVFHTHRAMHQVIQVVHDLQEHHGYFDTTRKLGIKSVYTGRSGTSQVERYSILADKVAEQINPATRHYARTAIKETETYLKKVERLLEQRKKE